MDTYLKVNVYSAIFIVAETWKYLRKFSLNAGQHKLCIQCALPVTMVSFAEARHRLREKAVLQNL